MSLHDQWAQEAAENREIQEREERDRQEINYQREQERERERREYNRQQEEAQYHEEIEFQNRLDQMADELMSNGYIVIPRCDIAKYMGKSFEITKKAPEQQTVDDDYIPF